MILTCIVCGDGFLRRGARGPIPKYCSQPCITKAGRTDSRRAYERAYRRAERASGGKRRAYESRYNRRPEVIERNRIRMFTKWHTDPEYREQQLARWRGPGWGVEIPAPYTGHRWLEMARAVAHPHLDSSRVWADDYHDDMGEAVLALLEGRDMKQAVSEYRKKEYVARHLTSHMNDWSDDDRDQDRWFESVMPTAPSAEDEAIDRESVVFYQQTKFSNVSTKRRTLHHKTQQPGRRRMKDAGWRKHEARKGQKEKAMYDEGR